MSTLPSFLTDPDPNIYYSDNFVSLDFETTNLEKGTALNGDNRIVLSCWEHGQDRGNVHECWEGELGQGELVAACNAADFLVAHNAKFELQWLDRCGYDVGSRPIYDTMLGEWVEAGNRPYGILPSLDDCLKRRGMGTKVSTVSKMIKAGICPSEIPRSLLLRYCKQDVRQTTRLFKLQLKEVEGSRLLPIIYTRCLVTPVLADIEKNGLHLDKERVVKLYEETSEEYERTNREFLALTDGINHRSAPQVAHFVYGELGFEEKKDRSGAFIRNKGTKQFPDGQPKTDEATLLSLRADTPEQERFLELKKKLAGLSAALDKNLALFYGACVENDGLFFGIINQARTKTHRFSSSGRPTKFEMFDSPKGCQFQNLPRVYKDLFSPRHEGWLIGEADGSQLEFRVAGHCGRDPVIVNDIVNGVDVHSYTRDVINSAGKEKIDRTGAKAHTFKPLYGGMSGTAAEKAYYEAFGEKYHKLHETQDEWCVQVGAWKFLETEWGMRYYWPEASYSRGGYLNVKTSVYNTAIQALATAEIIPIGLTFFWHRTRQGRIMIVNTVHDSIISEFPPEAREEYEEASVQALTHDVYTYLDQVYDLQFTVPLGVGITVGKHWHEPLEGEEEISIQVDTPYNMLIEE